jgi:hypothetical protein
MLALVGLHLRRALPRGYVAVIAVLLAFAVRRDWGVSAEVMRALEGAGSGRAAARQGVWLLALFCVLPFLVARAAATLPRWRAGESAWLGTRAISPGACLVAALAGPCLAALALGGAFFAAAELAAGGNERDAPRLVAEPHHAPLQLLAGAEGAEIVLPNVAVQRTGAGAGVLRLHLIEIPSDAPGIDVAIEARRGDASVGSARARVVGRGVVDVPLRALSAGGGPLVLAVRRVNDTARDPEDRLAGGVVAPRDSLELLRRDSGERRGSWALYARISLALAAMCALALGLGAWMRASLAALVTLALWLAAWTFDLGGGLVPGADLARALRFVGEGVAPPLPGAALALAAAAFAALGLVLGRLGLWDGRGVA